jgi:hypothetical protein
MRSGRFSDGFQKATDEHVRIELSKPRELLHA